MSEVRLELIFFPPYLVEMKAQKIGVCSALFCLCIRTSKVR